MSGIVELIFTKTQVKALQPRITACKIHVNLKTVQTAFSHLVNCLFFNTLINLLNHPLFIVIL